MRRQFRVNITKRLNRQNVHTDLLFHSQCKRQALKDISAVVTLPRKNNYRLSIGKLQELRLKILRRKREAKEEQIFSKSMKCNSVADSRILVRPEIRVAIPSHKILKVKSQTEDHFSVGVPRTNIGKYF